MAAYMFAKDVISLALATPTKAMFASKDVLCITSLIWKNFHADYWHLQTQFRLENRNSKTTWLKYRLRVSTSLLSL